MRYKKLIIIAVVILLIVFVGSKIVSISVSSPADNQQSVDDHSHDHPDQEKSSQVTVWDDRFEIFM